MPTYAGNNSVYAHLWTSRTEGLIQQLSLHDGVDVSQPQGVGQVTPKHDQLIMLLFTLIFALKTKEKKSTPRGFEGINL